MAIRRLTFRVPEMDAGTRLDLLVGNWLASALHRPLSKSTVRRLIIAGVVRIDGRAVRRPASTLRAGMRLEAVIDGARLPDAHGAPQAGLHHHATAPPRRDERPRERIRPTPDATNLRVLFEDEVLIAVAKPAGLQVHAAADPTRPDLYSLVRQGLSTRQEAAYLGLHHRLDRDTSGVVLFTKATRANAAVARQFERREVEKVYHALTVRPPRRGGGVREGSRWRLETPLAPVGTGRSARMEGVRAGGEEAATSFRVLRSMPLALLVRAEPETGRKHQIRAHLRESGSPILGDERYDGPSRVGGISVRRVRLRGRSLVLRHPVSGARLEIECEYPEDFRKLLEELAALTLARPSR